MTSSQSIKVGDEVRVLTHNRHRTYPEGGYHATVVKVGRRYATAAYETTSVFLGTEKTYQRTIEFDMATGVERDGSAYNGEYVRTPEQLERERQESAAIAVLREHNISLDFTRRRFTLEQIEALAEVVKTWED